MSKFEFFFPKGKRAPVSPAAPDESGYDNVVALLPRRSRRPPAPPGASAAVLALPGPPADPTDDGPPGPRAA